MSIASAGRFEADFGHHAGGWQTRAMSDFDDYVGSLSPPQRAERARDHTDQPDAGGRHMARIVGWPSSDSTDPSQPTCLRLRTSAPAIERRGASLSLSMRSGTAAAISAHQRRAPPFAPASERRGAQSPDARCERRAGISNDLRQAPAANDVRASPPTVSSLSRCAKCGRATRASVGREGLRMCPLLCPPALLNDAVEPTSSGFTIRVSGLGADPALALVASRPAYPWQHRPQHPDRPAERSRSVRNQAQGVRVATRLRPLRLAS